MKKFAPNEELLNMTVGYAGSNYESIIKIKKDEVMKKFLVQKHKRRRKKSKKKLLQ